MTCPVHQGSCGPGGAGRGRQRRPPLDAEDPTSPAPSPPGLESAHPELAGALVFAVYAQTSRHAIMVKYEHANLVLWTAGAEPCLWSPARRANPGIEPRARGPATGDPRLRALPASRHRTRIGHRTRARCPNLLQRRPRTPRTADRTAESCGFTSTTRTPQRPLQQIWTTHRPLDHPQPDSTRPTTPNEPGHTRRGGPARRARHSPRAESPGHPPRPRTRADRPGGRSPRASRPQPDRGAAPGRPRPHREPPAPTSRRAPVRLSP